MNRIPFLIYMGGCAAGLIAAAVGYGATTDLVVSPETTVVIPAARGAGGQLTFGLDRVPQLTHELLGIPAWQYLATGFYVLLAALAARLFDQLVTLYTRKAAVRTRTELDDLIIKLLHSPLKVVGFVVMLQFGLNLFHWPAWLERWVGNGLKLVLAVSLTIVALKMVDLGVVYWRRRQANLAKADKNFNDLLLPLVSKSLKAFLVVMALLVTLDNLNFNIRTLLAGVSITGLALGLAAQDTVGNLFGAAAVFMDKPFKIGDRIQLPGIDGVVEEMGLRSTRVRNLDGHLITVPNKTMGNATITNVTRRPNIKTVMNIGLTYDTPVEKVTEAVAILQEVYRSHPQTGDVIVGFNQFAENSLNIAVTHFWNLLDHKAYVAGMHGLNLEIKRRFDEARINFAFPSRTVYLRQENDWQIKLPDPAGAPSAQTG